MGFLNRLLRKSVASAAITTIGRAEGTFPGIRIADPGTPLLSYAPGNSVYETDLAVRDVIDYIASNIASLPFKVYRKLDDGDRQEAGETMLGRLISRPSPYLTRYRLFYKILTNGLVYDRWLCVLSTDSEDDLWLRPIPDRCFSIHGNSMDEIVAVQVFDSSQSSQRRGSVIYDYPNPSLLLDVGYASGGVDGTPLSTTLKPYLELTRVMTEYRAQVARNGGRVPAYVSRDKDIPWPNQAAQDEFAQGLRSYVRGGGSEGGWPIINDGMKILPLDAFKPIDMQDLDARDRIRIEVANAFHISPENLGFRAGTNSNISAFKDQKWNSELMPYIVSFEQALNLVLPHTLGEDSDELYIEANVDAKLRGTFETQYQALSTATGRPFLTTNEARGMLNRPRLTEGDELITPLNVTQGGQPSPQDGGRTQNAQTNTNPNGGGK